MGGSALANTTDATAAAINPADLESIDSWSVTGTFAPFFPANTAPFTPGGSTHSDRSLFPLGFVGFGVRVFDKAVTGLAVYTESGAGASYSNLPELGGMSMGLQLGVIEAALPISYAITDQLSVGASARLGFTTMSVDMPVDMGGGPMRLQQSMSGLGLPGVSAGVRYQPIERLSLAASYRSKITMPLSGDGTATIPMLGAQPFTVESEWSTPHSFGLGAAFSVLPQQLLISTDVRYALLDNAVDNMDMTISMQGQPTPMQSALTLQWKNSFSWGTGAEYRVAKFVPLRAGYCLTTSATKEEYAVALGLAPGLLHSVHAGAGVELADFAIDLGAAYSFASSEVTNSVNGPPGTYSSNSILFSLSATYRPSAAPARSPVASNN
jgi:long-subunit fatty acid transport protein